jgi:hypothetical protein
MRKVLVALGFFACAGGFVGLTATAGTQQCNTACQSRMTDCLLACDGRRPCEEECKRKAVGCVEVCTSDAGPPAPPSAPPPDAQASAEAAVISDAKPGDGPKGPAKPDAGRTDAKAPPRDR